MTNEITRRGIEEILSTLDNNSLISLATTVTQGLLKNKIESRQEAIKTIIEYSPDEQSILKRKIVTRDVLFSYLHRKNVAVNLPVTKQNLIEKISTYWNVGLSSESNECTENTVTLLAEQFSKWFYSILNSSECMGSEHFYADAVLKINIHSDGQYSNSVVENNPEEIAQHLFITKKQYNLFFNPNLTKEGVQGRVDPHGLVIVLICGTLHSNDACIGIFEQNFYLAKDPFSENNWRIKRTELNLKSRSHVIGLPTLCDSEFNSNLINLHSTY